MIEFNLRFVDTPLAPNERKADHALDKALASEVSGILAWLVQGCLQWQEEGLEIPTSIQIATEAYRDSEDRILHFIEETCVVAANATVSASKLYDAYVQFCKDNQMKALDGKLFGQDIAKRFEKARKIKGVFYVGIGLLETDLAKNEENHVGTMYGEIHPTYTSKSPSQAALEDVSTTNHVGYVGKTQVFSLYHDTPPSRKEKHDFTLHTLHGDNSKSGLKPPVDSDEAPYTEEIHPTCTLHAAESDILAQTDLAAKKDEARALAKMFNYPRHHYQYGQFLDGETSYAEAIERAVDISSVEKILAVLRRA